MAALTCAGLASCMPSYDMELGRAVDRACPDLEAHAWYIPVGEKDNERLERWCVTVGPEVVRERPMAAHAPLQPGEDLTVLSWNVAAGGGDALEFLRREAGIRCAGRESELAPGAVPFVLLVQEAFRRSPEIPEAGDDRVIPRAVVEADRPGGRPDILEVAERCGLSLVYVAAARNGPSRPGETREDRGVAILSTLPLRDVQFMELPFEAARRVAVAAVIRNGSGASLRVVTVHLTSAAPPARTVVTGNGSRLRQSLGLIDALQLACDPDGAEFACDEGDMSTLLGGDLNTWSTSETSLIHLRDWFSDSPPPLAVPTRGEFPTDHILFRQGPGRAPRLLDATYERLGERYHSDHHGIRARLRFRG